MLVRSRFESKRLIRMKICEGDRKKDGRGQRRTRAEQGDTAEQKGSGGPRKTDRQEKGTGDSRRHSRKATKR